MKRNIGLLLSAFLFTYFAATAHGRSVSIDFTGGQNAVIRGVHVIKDYWFELSEDWEFHKPALLDLRISHSPICKRDLSTFTVSVNGSPIHSFYLDKSNMSDAQMAIEVPGKLFRGGMNVLTFTVKMRSDLEDLCDDVHNPALWTVIQRESRLTVTYEEKKVNPDLAGFPRDYLNPDLLYEELEDRVHAFVLMAPKPGLAEWDALATLAALLGQEAGMSWGEFRVFLGEAANPSLIKNSHIIIIGMPDFLKSFSAGRWSLNIPLDQVMREPLGFIMEFQSPFNPSRRVLVVTGRDEGALRLVAQNLRWPLVARGLKGQIASFEKPPSYSAPATEWSEAAFVVRLVDLKLSDLVMRGKFYHSTQFTIPNPFVGKIKDGAFLRLSMSHSELLLPQSSSLLVKINGEPLKSIRLTRETAARNTWDVKIPLPLLWSRHLTFELEVFLDIGDPECYYYHPEMAWFTLHNDSLLYLPIDAAQEETLANYPYMFLKWDKFDNLAIVLVEPITSGIATAAFNALAFLSQSLRNPAFVEARLVPSSALSEADRASMNMLVVGALGSVMADSVWQQMLPKELGIRLGAQGTSDILNNFGFLSLIKNPFGASQRVLSLVGRSDREIFFAAPYLYAPGKVEWLRGTLAMVGSDGELRVLLPEAPTDAVARFDPTKVRFEEKDGKLTPVVEPAGPVNPPPRHNVAYLVFFVLTPALVLLVILRLRALARGRQGQG